MRPIATVNQKKVQKIKGVNTAKAIRKGYEHSLHQATYFGCNAFPTNRATSIYLT